MTSTSFSSTLLVGLFATLLAVSGVQSAGHRVPLSQIRLPERTRQHPRDLMRQPNTWLSQLHRYNRVPSAKASDAGSVSFSTWALDFGGNVSIGSPAQIVPVAFSERSQDFYLLNPNGHCNLDTSSEAVEPSSDRYDASSSTTASTSNLTFHAEYGYVRGNTSITDSFLFDTLNMTLNFGDASYFPWWISGLGVAGVVGISPKSQGDSNLTSFAAQLLASNIEPIVAKYVSFKSEVDETVVYVDGQMTIGAEDDDSCTAGSYVYTPLGPSDEFANSFRVDSISGQTPDGQALSLAINVNQSVVLQDGFGVVASTDFFHLLANASGLTYNESTGYYELSSCDDLSKAQNLTMNLGDGNKLTLAPIDYIFKTTTNYGDEKCVADFWDSQNFDEASQPEYPIVLGRLFLNNHCYAYNYRDMTLGIASVKTPSLTLLNYS